MISLIRSELRKLLSTKVWIGLLLGGMAFAALSVVLTLAFAGDARSGLGPVADPATQRVAFSSIAAAGVFVVILSVIGMTQEFRHKTATPTFLATPQRARVVVAKLITYLAAGLVLGVMSGAVVVAIAVPWISHSGVPASITGDDGSVLLGGMLAVALYSILGVGIGALVRNQVGAIVGALVYLFVLEPIIKAIPATLPVYRLLPGGASEALSATLQTDNLLSRWQGALLLIGYGLLAAGLAMTFTLRRDVL